MDRDRTGTGTEPEVTTAAPGPRLDAAGVEGPGADRPGADRPGADRPGPAGPTGHPLVDAALAQLDRVADRDAAEQVTAYEETHRVLQQTLATIDQA